MREFLYYFFEGRSKTRTYVQPSQPDFLTIMATNIAILMISKLHLAFLLSLISLVLAHMGLKFNETKLAFAEYRPWDVSTNGAVEIYFRTAKRNALLLYQDDGEGKDWIDVFLINGKARLRLRMGTCDRENTILKGNFTDSKWHHLRVKRNFSSTTISIDGVEAESLDCKKTSYSPVKPKPNKSSLYLGGIPLLSKPIGHWANPNIFLEAQYHMFTGCIARVRYSNADNKLRRVKYKKSSGTTSNCHGACAEENMCKNGGKCIDMVVSMRCDCRGTGYVGKYCDEQVTVVHLETNNSTLNSTVISRHVFRRSTAVQPSIQIVVILLYGFVVLLHHAVEE